MNKISDYLSIQEFSKLSGVEASTLRYWDVIGLFSPLIRNPDNNYRYYSTVQLLALNFVATLSELEIPLKTIASLREDRDKENLLDLLEKQEKLMDMEMRNLRMRYSIIHARRELINFGSKVDETEISINKKDELAMFLWPQNEYSEGDTFLEPLAAHLDWTRENHINLSFPVGGYHNDMDSFQKSPGQPNRFISIDPVGSHVQKAGDYLVGYARGYYAQLGDLPDRMNAYAAANSLSLVGPVYTIYLLEEFCTAEPQEYLAQCSVEIKRIRS
ncbi:MAG: MerR family transcriptional regulator [Oscillospiraceae bacterium]|nr:MerR family transcriptional regulator [Oscillospiraceae bacterium]